MMPRLALNSWYGRPALVSLGAGILLLVAAGVVGVSDNVPGIALLGLGIGALMLALGLQWKWLGIAGIIGTMVGFAVGAIPGIKVGLVVGTPVVDCPDCTADRHYMLIGAFVGMALITPLAVHLANRRRGALAPAYYRSVIIAAVGLALLFFGIARQLAVPWALGFLMTPLALVESAARAETASRS
jgi:hypothetical protein